MISLNINKSALHNSLIFSILTEIIVDRGADQIKR